MLNFRDAYSSLRENRRTVFITLWTFFTVVLVNYLEPYFSSYSKYVSVIIGAIFAILVYRILSKYDNMVDVKTVKVSPRLQILWILLIILLYIVVIALVNIL